MALPPQEHHDRVPECPVRQGAVRVLEALRGAGYETYWAGGCVRDLLLDRPAADYDIATAATPDEITGLFARTVEVGRAFGVICVLEGDASYDVATFRADGDYTDGRRPDDVSWASAREDVLRRDFTINGLLYDPVARQVIDFVDGRADLEAGIIRAIGVPSERFAEDYLRILRAIRFSARLGFPIDEETARAMKEAAPGVQQVSSERVHYEVGRILTEEAPALGLRLIEEMGLREFVVPELTQLASMYERFTGLDRLPLGTAWAMLVDAQGLCDREVVGIARRLRFSTDLRKQVLAICDAAGRVRSYASQEQAEQKRTMRHPEIEAAQRLVGAANADDPGLMASTGDSGRWTRIELFPPALLKGDDLRAMGLQPGPRFGQILRALETAQLAGTVTTLVEARDLARQFHA